MSWISLLAILGVLATAWAWHANLAAREMANRIATETCNQAGVQFLDGTVSTWRLSLVRGGDGWLALRRTYTFDYSEDGYTRRRGFVVLTGLVLDSVGLGPRAVQ